MRHQRHPDRLRPNSASAPIGLAAKSAGPARFLAALFDRLRHPIRSITEPFAKAGLTVAILALGTFLLPATAAAAVSHPYVSSFNDAGSFAFPRSIAVDQSTDSVYVFDGGVKRFDSAGSPQPFTSSAAYISGNAITGPPSTEQGSFGNGQIALDNSGRPGHQGNIYVTGAPIEEVQEVTVQATGGTFTLTLEGHTTAPLPFNASAGEVERALENLVTTRSSAKVTSANATYTVTFYQELSGVDVPQLVPDGTELTGPSPSVTVTTQTNGAPPRVYVFAPTGQFLEAVHLHRASVAENSQGNFEIHGIALDSAGDLYVSGFEGPSFEAESPTVEIFDPSGSFLTQLEPPAGSAGPANLAFDPTGHALYVILTPFAPGAVSRYALSPYPPTASTTATATSVGPAGVRVFGLAVDPYDSHLLLSQISEAFAPQLAEFDASGSELGTFGEPEGEYPGVAFPLGIGVNAQTGLIYVSEPTVPQVSIFSTPKLHLTANVSGSGTIECQPPLGAPEPCAAEYPEATTLTAIATPATHNQFKSWAGCDSVSGAECHLTLSAAKTITASFAPITHALAIAAAGTGQGSVTCNGAPCASSYPEGTEVALAATAASGSAFAGFSGGGCSASPCQLTLAADTQVTATFDANPVPPPPPPGEEAKCVVPRLEGKTLARARALLGAAHCALGKVTKPKARKGHRLGQLVVKSSTPAVGATLPVGAKVSLRLVPKPSRKK